MKNLLFLGLLLIGLLISGCASSVVRTHNLLSIGGNYTNSRYQSGLKVNITNNVDGILYIKWDEMPLCTIAGGPCNKVGLCKGETFTFICFYSIYEYEDFALFVNFMDTTESRIFHTKKVISYIFKNGYGRTNTYNWNFSGEEGDIQSEIQPSGGGGYFVPFGYW